MCELFNFFDAGRLAIELLERGDRNDAVVFFRGCQPSRVEVIPAAEADVFSMIDRVVRHADREPTAFQTVFLRAGRDVGAELVERDLGLFRLARRHLAADGIDLLDWIHTDGELLRSMSYASDPSRAWTSDDEAIRRRALELLARHALAWSWGCGGPLDGLRSLERDPVDPGDFDPDEFDDVA